MTAPARRPEDDALDRLEEDARGYLGGPRPTSERRADFATVREALERLRSVKAIAQIKGLLERAESAEAEARRLREERDVAEGWDERTRRAWDEEVRARIAAEAEVRQLREELDDLRDEYMADAGLRTAAEAEVRRLTEGLREIADGSWNIPGPGHHTVSSYARALLSADPPQGDAAAGSSPSDEESYRERPMVRADGETREP